MIIGCMSVFVEISPHDLTQCVLLKNDIEPYPQKCCLYTANSIDYVIAKWEARNNHAAMNFAMTFVCTYVHVCVCKYVRTYLCTYASHFQLSHLLLVNFWYH